MRRMLEFAGVEFEKFQVTDDSVGVDDYPPHGRGVAVPVLQRGHTPPQVADQVM